MSVPNSLSVTSAYRTLGTLIRRLPQQQREGARKQLRNDFRKNADAEESQIPSLLEVSSKMKPMLIEFIVVIAFVVSLAFFYNILSM